VKKYILPLVLFFQMLLLFTEVPNWVIVTSLLFLILSTLSWIKKLPHIKTITGVVSVIVVIAAVQQFNFILSNELIASLLIILTSIRLIEHRFDQAEPPYFLFLLGLFLAVVKFVFQIDFIFGVYAFLATLFYLYQFFPESFQKNYPKESFKVLRTIIFYSVPMTVLLFLIFPQFKFDGGRQRNYGLFSQIGASGFSGELRPGSISELVNNETIAFRAEFTDYAPSQGSLYWRGQVLDRAQGLLWRRSNPLNHTPEVTEDETTVFQPQYKIILEPHYKEQLFTLYETDAVNASEKLLVSDKNNTYSLPSALSERLVYNGAIQFKLVQKLTQDREEYLHLNRRSAKVEQLLKNLMPASQEVQSAEQKVKLLAKFFAENKFEYRLSGQELAVNSLEDFLFKTKTGFCEHYASAAALLLRYWGVPSRVVVGYQGGEFNRAGNFWTVKQQDAHAWVEYLNENNVWTLYDPITAIAPDRIAVGATFLMNSTERGQLWKQLSNRFSIFDQISTFLETSNYRWTLFFVEYSSSNFKRQIIKFYEDNEDVQLAARLIFLLVCIFIMYRLTKKFIYRRRPLNERYYLELDHFFAKRLPQEKNESFDSWKTRLLKKYPAMTDVIEEVFSIYLRNRYGAQASQSEFKRFKSLLNKNKFN